MNAVLSRPHARFPRLSRLGWLMGLYGENHAKIARLFDVRALARPVLRHRVLVNFQAQSEKFTTDAMVARLLDSVSVPRSTL